MEVRSLIHDLNNALTTVLGHAEWLLSPEADRTHCERELLAIRNSAEHAAELARELREWVRRVNAAGLSSPSHTLPFPAPPALRAVDPPRLPNGARRILVVDDQPEVRQSVSDMLSALGHLVTASATAAEALEFLKQGPVDLMLTDYSMPDMNGVTLAARAHTLRPGLPIVLLTGWGAEADEPSEHVRLVLAKPVTLGDLADAVSRAADRMAA